MTDHCYIAARLFTPAQIRVNARIAAIVREVGMEPVLPSEMSAPVWRGRSPKDCTPEERCQVVEMNITGMHGSRIMVARVSGDTKEVDTGVAWEMGYFLALSRVPLHLNYNKVRILIAYIEPSDREQSLNLMLAETFHAAVYGDAQLHACLTAIRDAEAVGGGLQPEDISAWAPDKIIKHEREPIGADDDVLSGFDDDIYEDVEDPHWARDDKLSDHDDLSSVNPDKPGGGIFDAPDW